MRVRVKLALALCLIAAPALGQERCGARGDVADLLATRYGEEVASLGVSGELLIEMWGNRASGSWSITATDAQGKMCLLASGDGFKAVVLGKPA